MSVNGLRKTYGAREIVSSLSFTVEQGQVFAFLGPNGAGKSTTMNMIGTLLEKSGGEIYIDGKNMDIDKNIIKKKIGIVFQEDVLDGDLTIYNNLLYRGGLYGGSEQEVKKQINNVVQLLSLHNIMYQKYKRCSGGQKRLAQIARALLPKPKLLILDEPTTGLDPVTRKNVWEVLEKLRRELKMTIFYTTHYLDEAAYADNICILKNGKIVLCGNLSQIQKMWKGKLKEPTLENIYFRLLKEEGICEA